MGKMIEAEQGRHVGKNWMISFGPLGLRWPFPYRKQEHSTTFNLLKLICEYALLISGTSIVQITLEPFTIFAMDEIERYYLLPHPEYPER